MEGLSDGSRVATDSVAQRWLNAASDHAPKCFRLVIIVYKLTAEMNRQLQFDVHRSLYDLWTSNCNCLLISAVNLCTRITRRKLIDKCNYSNGQNRQIPILYSLKLARKQLTLENRQLSPGLLSHIATMHTRKVHADS